MKFKLVPKKKKNPENFMNGKKGNGNGTNSKSFLNVSAKNFPTKNLVDQKSRARACEGELAKIVKRVPLFLNELITNQDRNENITVIRTAKKANSRVWDPALQRMVDYPDFKTRLAAATLQLAYDEGTPVQRQMILTANFDSADKTIAKIKESPELLKAIQALQGVGLTLENGAGEAIDIEAREVFENQGVAPKTETEQSS